MILTTSLGKLKSQLFGVLSKVVEDVTALSRRPCFPCSDLYWTEFTEINFSDKDVRLNALSEAAIDTLTLRDGSFADYELFGFSERPEQSRGSSDRSPLRGRT
jgi:hypothetical protein